MTLKNVPVAPVEELLMRWAKCMERGPTENAWHLRCAGLRHYRGEQPIDDRALDLDNINQWLLEKGQLFWCGPIVDHLDTSWENSGSRTTCKLRSKTWRVTIYTSRGRQAVRRIIP